ncbi:MAG: TVP38/TMEM64 family protein [Clostridia bacterium]
MNKKLTKKEKIYMFARMLMLLVVIGLMIWATITALPFVSKLGDEAYRLEFKDYIASMGLKGVFMILGMQILQIIIAVIPGQPMEIVSGMLYGTIGGMIVCLIGIFIGTTLIFFLVRKVGTDFMQLFFSKEQIDKTKKSKIFKNPQKFELLMLIIFLIPFIPKDIFIYLGGLSPVRAKRFLAIATFGRIPGLFITVYAGNKLSEGSFVLVGILIAIFSVVGVIGYYVSSKAQEKLEKES